jgi:hypothetical protein
VDTDIGEEAYIAYAEARAWQTYGGQPMPSWYQQDEDVKDAWYQAAMAVVRCIKADLPELLK